MAHVRLGAFDIARQGFSLRNEFRLGAIDKIGEVGVPSNIHLRGFIELSAADF